ncbi:MAG: hypothetical protein PVG32_21390 [Anaerolineales bacterium]|jgi:hypothetical protein
MKNLFTSLNTAITLSVIALLTEVWRGFLDAMFVFPVDIGDESLMQLAALAFTLIFAAWAWSLVLASRGSRRGLITAFIINALILLAIPVSWLFVYCPADCRAEAGIFNLANTLNLVFGLLAAIALGLQFRRSQKT